MYEFFQIVGGLHDDPTLFPVLSDPEQQLPFQLEPADGNRRDLVESRSVAVVQRTAGGWTQLRTFKDLRFVVVITDARAVVYCEKWSKGGGWRGFGLGGLAFAAAANAVSHARAAHRRKGKLLVAQLRYPWLAQTAVVVDRRGRPSAVRLVVDAGTRTEQRLLALDIVVPGEPAALAAGIATLAARHRLAGGRPVPESEAAAWQRLAQDAAPHGSGGVWSLPSAVPVGSTPPEPIAPASPEYASPPAGEAIPRPEQSPGSCPACGHAASLAAATCPRCGLAVAEQGGSAAARALTESTMQMRDPIR